MKTPREWLSEAEPSMPLAPSLDESMIRRIQADVFKHAAKICKSNKKKWRETYKRLKFEVLYRTPPK